MPFPGRRRRMPELCSDEAAFGPIWDLLGEVKQAGVPDTKR